MYIKQNELQLKCLHSFMIKKNKDKQKHYKTYGTIFCYM